MSTTTPAFFLSHGGPSLALPQEPGEQACADFLRGLPAQLGEVKALIALSPHWGGRLSRIAVKAPPRFAAWHDFGGFADALYQLQYAPPGASALAEAVVAQLNAAGLATERVEDNRLDHGLWVPMRHAWPAAELPLVQVALPFVSPAQLFALGQALAPLCTDGVRLMASGGLVHNLRELAPGDAPEGWAQDFEQWMHQALLAGDVDALLDYRARAPAATRAHPTDEHLLPLFVALGVAPGPAKLLHRGWSYGSLSMAAYALG